MRNIDKICTYESEKIKKVIEIIDRGKLGIAVVIDKNKKLLGIVTDVDIRRGILKGISLEASVRKVMNSDPKKILEGRDKSEIISLMKKYNIRQVPVVNKLNQVIGLELLNDYLGEVKHSNFVIIMAGGRGKRLRPLTKETPKPMLILKDKPILENILESFKNYGFCNFIITINYQHKKIFDYFKHGEKWSVNIQYLKEKKQLGTAGALSMLNKKDFKEPFFVVNSDLLTSVNFEHMLEYHKSHNCIATIGIKEYPIEIPYGIIRVNNELLEDVDEKPMVKFYINAGIYIFAPEILSFIKNKGYMDMTEFIESIKDKGLKVVCFPIHEYWLDIGHFDNYIKAKKDFKRYFR